MCYPVMHVTSMDLVDRRRGDALVINAFVRRECQERLEVEGRLPVRRGGGKACSGGVDADDEPQPELESKPQMYMDMDMEMEMEMEMENDVEVEVEEEVGDDDDDEQRQRWWNRVLEPIITSYH